MCAVTGKTVLVGTGFIIIISQVNIYPLGYHLPLYSMSFSDTQQLLKSCCSSVVMTPVVGTTIILALYRTTEIYPEVSPLRRKKLPVHRLNELMLAGKNYW